MRRPESVTGRRTRRDAPLDRLQLSRPNLDPLRRLETDRIVVAYDRASDTLMIHFYGRGRAAVSVPFSSSGDRDSVFCRIDPETEDVVGFQIEEFLPLYVGDHPRAVDWLAAAELRGIDPAAAARIRREHRADRRSPESVATLLAALIAAG